MTGYQPIRDQYRAVPVWDNFLPIRWISWLENEMVQVSGVSIAGNRNMLSHHCNRNVCYRIDLSKNNIEVTICVISRMKDNDY